MKAERIELDTVERLPGRGGAGLSLVTPATAGERARRLHLEAKRVSLEHLDLLKTSLSEARDLAQAVVDAGDLYAAGVQDFAARLSEELFWRAKTLEALGERQRAPAAVR